jgi:hypothetical protein
VCVPFSRTRSIDTADRREKSKQAKAGPVVDHVIVKIIVLLFFVSPLSLLNSAPMDRDPARIKGHGEWRVG